MSVRIILVDNELGAQALALAACINFGAGIAAGLRRTISLAQKQAEIQAWIKK